MVRKCWFIISLNHIFVPNDGERGQVAQVATACETELKQGKSSAKRKIQQLPKSSSSIMDNLSVITARENITGKCEKSGGNQNFEQPWDVPQVTFNRNFCCSTVQPSKGINICALWVFFPFFSRNKNALEVKSSIGGIITVRNILISISNIINIRKFPPTASYLPKPEAVNVLGHAGLSFQ